MTGGRSSREALVFGVATLLSLVHALDDAFVHRGAGLGLGQHAAAGVIALGAAVAAIAVLPSLRPGLRAAVAFTFGGLALVNGGMHVAHALHHGPAAGDVTGILAARAGAVLVGLAVVIPWHHRGQGGWTARVLAVPAGFLAVLFVLGPIGLGIVETHKWREPAGAPPSAAYRDVHFKATDGLDLAGWYRPSRNGAAVVIVHGGGSDRKGSVAHAQLLARHGYGPCSTTPAGAARATAPRTATAGTGPRTSPARSGSSRDAPTSTRAASARSGSRPAPTWRSRSRRSGTIWPPS